MAKKLFDHINHIIYTKDKNYLQNLSEEDRKTFSMYMILKFLSMDYELTSVMNYFNMKLGVVPDEAIYKMLISVIPTKKYNLKYLKVKNGDDSADSDITEFLSSFFDISKRKAFEYNKLLNNEEISFIKSLAKKN